MIERWLPRVRPRPAADLRLFLFPYAGGGATLFRNWSDAFPTTVEVLPVQLPGREERIREPAFSRMDALADAVAQTLWPLTDCPTVLFGWSMGAALAYGVARRWEIMGRRPALLIPAAHRAPHLPLRTSPIHHLPSDLFWKELAGMGGLPEEALNCQDLRDFMEPTLRADFAAVETRPLVQPRTLSCPIAAVAAEDDRTVAWRDVEAWTETTHGTTEFAMIPGGHFAVRDDRSTVISQVRALLRRASGNAGEPRSSDRTSTID